MRVCVCRTRLGSMHVVLWANKFLSTKMCCEQLSYHTDLSIVCNGVSPTLLFLKPTCGWYSEDVCSRLLSLSERMQCMMMYCLL